MTENRPPDSAVLLDVDGTLVDTNWIHTVAWARALRRCGRLVPMHRIHPLVGMGADLLVEELVGEEVPGASEAHHDEYEALRPDVRLLPGARELIRAVHDLGLAVVLASSSKEDELDFLRTLLDAEDWLSAATSSGDAEVSKPAPDIFAAALDRVGVAPERAIVVGDTVWDVQAADRAGLSTVGLLTGGTRGIELLGAGAVEVHEDPAALCRALAGSAIARLAATG